MRIPWLNQKFFRLPIMNFDQNINLILVEDRTFEVSSKHDILLDNKYRKIIFNRFNRFYSIFFSLHSKEQQKVFERASILDK